MNPSVAGSVGVIKSMGSVFDNDNGDVAPKAVKVEPPAGEEKKKRGRPKGSVSQKTVDKIEDSINEFLALPALYFAAIGDMQCSWILTGENSPGRQWAASWAQLAKQSPAVRNALQKMMQGGAWGGVIASTFMVIIPIAAHHGALPERFNLMAQMMMPGPESEDE